MTEIHNLFDKEELFLLRKIGIEFDGNKINIFKQGLKKKRIRSLNLSNIKSVTIYKTNRRKFSWLSIFNLFNQDIMMEANEHASQIYCLKFTLKNRSIAQIDIEDFDVIRTSKLLERLNAYFESLPINSSD